MFCTQSVTPDAGTDIKYTVFSYILSTSANTTPILAATGATGAINVGKTCYFPLIGYVYAFESTWEPRTLYKFRVAATLSNLYAYVYTNTITAASTLITRRNRINGSQSVSITASTTGGFEDTVNSDNIASGNNVNLRLVTGATGTSIALSVFQVKSNSAGRQVAAASSYIISLVKGRTTYITIEGNCQSINDDETLVQVTARTAFIAKNMYVNLYTNGITNTTTFTLRKDGANGGLLVSVPSGATGQFEDLDPAHATNFVAASLINWRVVTPYIGTSICISCIGFELAQSAPP
ncbi:unnamed protein product, partial [marine sediment metagenome]